MAKTLKQHAKDVADDVKAEAAQAHRRLAEIADERARLDADESRVNRTIAASGNADQRLGSFDGSSCPSCAIREGREVPLDARDGGTDDFDVMRCRECKREYEVAV